MVKVTLGMSGQYIYDAESYFIQDDWLFLHNVKALRSGDTYDKISIRMNSHVEICEGSQKASLKDLPDPALEANLPW